MKMKAINMRYATAFVLFVLTVSCAEQSQLVNNSVSVDNPTVDIFAARGFLGGSNYERYFLKNGELFRECGDLKEEGNPSPSTIAPGIFSTHSSIYPKDGSKVTLKAEELSKFHSAVYAVIKSLSDNAIPTNLDPPQNPFRLAQGGVFELKITSNSKTYQIKTSLDQLSANDNSQLQNPLQLFTTVRSFGSPMCNNQVFFGIGR